ncbi:ester cyclase [Paraflavisolibacter sp. H34]|uniref:ester cyclase n=1 Tax=Huijunlia imazamoxiresistens TaxID=3127457 RepID=UPI003019F41B
MKKRLLVLAGTALWFSACRGSNSPAVSEQEAKEERNRQTALASVQATSRRDADGLLKDAAPGMADYGDGSLPVIRGVDRIKPLLHLWFTAFPDVQRNKLVAVADGDWVMVWGTWSGTFKNDLMGIKATGKAYRDVPDVDIFKFNAEGKIIEHHNVQSPNTFLLKAGAQLPPP